MTIRVDQYDLNFYSWEQNTSWYLKNCDPISLKECQVLVNKIRKDFKYRPKITIKDGRGSLYGRAVSRYAGGGRIELPRWARNRCVVLHEVAHIISPNEELQHGPSFLMTYAMLLEKYIKIDPVKVILHSRFFGVKIK